MRSPGDSRLYSSQVPRTARYKRCSSRPAPCVMSGLLLDPGTLVILGVVALAAFATEGAIGFGGTVLAASIGAQFVPLEVLLPAFVPLNLVLSSWLLSRGRHVVAWRLLVTEVAPAVAIGAALGMALFHLPAKTLLALVFGVFVIGLAALQLVRPADRRLARPLQLGLLGLGGVAHGLFGPASRRGARRGRV